MEEQRQRQEEEARLTTVASAADACVSSTVADGEFSVMLISASFWHAHLCFVICAALSVSESPGTLLKMSVPHTDSSTPALPDFSRMTEDEQIAYALQMSMQGAGGGQI